MIYCVIPYELRGDLFDRLADYYADEPNVQVITERRRRERRAFDGYHEPDDQRRLRDRRRPRIPGDLPPTPA
jgi:hypothetical protein